MKKLILLVSFIAVFSTAYAQQFLVGGGLVYGTDVNKGGIDIRGDIRLTQKWAIVPNINFFFPDSRGTYKASFTGINIDGHYLHELSSEAHVYPLFGLNFSTSKVKETTTGFKNSNTELGINLGGGLEYFFSSKVAGLFEIKYVIGDYDQGVLTFGVLYAIN